MTKREAEWLEQMIRSLTDNEAAGLTFGWLASGCDGPLWDYMRSKPKGKSDARQEKNHR